MRKPRFVLFRFDRAGHQHWSYVHPTRYEARLNRPWDFVVDERGYLYVGGEFTVKLQALAERSEGDLDGAGCVSDGDLARVLLKFGRNAYQGDVNGDGVVNEMDIQIVLENFGLGCGGFGG